MLVVYVRFVRAKQPEFYQLIPQSFAFLAVTSDKQQTSRLASPNEGFTYTVTAFRLALLR
jgi:hypothetical protein